MITTLATPRYNLALLPQELHSAAHTLRGHTARQTAGQPSHAPSRPCWGQLSQAEQALRLAKLEAATLHTQGADGYKHLRLPAEGRVILQGIVHRRWPWSREHVSTACRVTVITATETLQLPAA